MLKEWELVVGLMITFEVQDDSQNLFWSDSWGDVKD